MILHICRSFRTILYVPLIFDNSSFTDAFVQTSGTRDSCHVYP